MKPEEIKLLRETVLYDLSRAEAEVKLLQSRLQTIQKVCEHPNKFLRDHSGEDCIHCPDCGKCEF